jgi:PAS domain S-box-containing protein
MDSSIQQHLAVLLIDDEAAGMRLRKLVLESNGFTVFSSADSEEALSLFRRHDVDVVITDHLLGRTTAVDLANEIRRSKPYVPIVSLSGTSNSDEVLEYADYFVSKGDGPDALMATLNQITRTIVAGAQPQAVGRKPTVPPDRATLQELLSAIVEDSTDAILSKTLDGTILSWNRAAEDLYGYTREEILGDSVEKLLPPDRPDEIKHILARLKRGERISRFETVRVAKDGRHIDVSLTISPVRDESGQLVGASAIAHDITERKKTEEALRKAEKLALAGRMLTTVAHEINNPLESIGNVLYLLRKNPNLDAGATAFVEAAQEELKRVADITRVTLGIQRGQSMEHERVDITKLLDNVVTLYSRRAATIGVTIERKYKGDGAVIGSLGELRQVFSNLFINALDALTKTGSRLVLGVRNATDWATGENGVRVSICDNGSGITPERRANLFQAFYTTKGEQGTGIGLWVSKSIVLQHNGSIRLRSSVRPGHTGTCFSVFLPSDRKPEPKAV